MSSNFKILSLCDGISAGLMALDKLGVNCEYYAVEIDKYPRMISDHNFPGRINRFENDVTKITKEQIRELGPFDLVMFGSPCFIAGTKVLTSTGYKNIEEIRVGELVLTHKGRFKKVLKVGGKVSPTRRLKFQGTREIITTDEHPFLCKKMVRKCIERKPTRVFSEECWVEAKDIGLGTFGKQAEIKSYDSIKPVSEEIAFIIGRYLADGHYRKSLRTEKGRENDFQYQLILSVGSHKVDVLKEKIKDTPFSIHPHSKSVYRVTFSNKWLVEYLISLGFENGASNKKIPMEVFSWDLSLQKQLLEGYLSGDGCFRDGEYSCNSVSEELMLGVQLLATRVYGVKANYSFFERPKTTIIEGRTVNQRDTHSLTFKTSIPKQANYRYDEDGLFFPIKSNDVTGENERVYNLEVEDDNSYTVYNTVVHNCQSFSVAGTQTGLQGKSGLIVDCLKVRDWVLEFNPEAKFLIENVKMKKEFLNQINDLIGTIPTLINSARLSAQNRERYYWHNFEVTQPEDTEEKFNDILETKGIGAAWSKSTRYLDVNGKKTYTKSNGGVSSYVEERLSYGKANTLTCGKNCGSQSSYNVVIYGEDTKRKLTVRECARLQKIEDSFDFSIVSNTQAYKAIGNSWTVSVIAHILSHGPARWFL